MICNFLDYILKVLYGIIEMNELNIAYLKAKYINFPEKIKFGEWKSTSFRFEDGAFILSNYRENVEASFLLILRMLMFSYYYMRWHDFKEIWESTGDGV